MGVKREIFSYIKHIRFARKVDTFLPKIKVSVCVCNLQHLVTILVSIITLYV